MKYKINEFFSSIQGEGRHAGRYVTFIRFSGCNLNCSFCDTKHDTFTEMSEAEIMNEIARHNTDTIIFTGGEPTIQIKPNAQGWNNLIKKIRLLGKKVHLETNGTMPIASNFDWVTVSPKENWLIKKGDELKVIYTGQDLTQYDNADFQYKYLQPCDDNGIINYQDTINKIKENPEWTLSIQLQKILKIQ